MQRQLEEQRRDEQNMTNDFAEYFEEIGKEVEVEQLRLDKEKQHGQIRRFIPEHVQDVIEDLWKYIPTELITVTVWRSQSMYLTPLWL